MQEGLLMEERHDIVIVGAGASGLMCGYLLGRDGRDVCVIEKNKSAGKKLLATGNGRCNFTNRRMSEDCYFGDSEFIRTILRRADDRTVIQLFEEIGIYHRERDGYCYPYSGQASTVVELLVDGCAQQGVQFRFDTKVSKILHKSGEYVIHCKNGDCYRCEKLVLACGGKAAESLGGDGSGYKLCRSLSHHVTPLYPGLTGLRADGDEWNALAGVRMQGRVTLAIDGRTVKCESGEIQIVKDGISGIPVFQLCRLAAAGLSRGSLVTVFLDFFPERGEEWLAQWLSRQGIQKLSGLVHKKWCGIIEKRAAGSVPELVRMLKQYEVRITDTFGLERAQVTAGGIVTGEVCPETMQSKLHEGLYMIGELLDVDGICGGYNLQFAWSTAYVCAGAI